MSSRIESEIEKVHVIFKTHLDIGFTEFSKKVMYEYINLYIPEAIKLGNELKGSKDIGFKWTTSSWLIYHCLRTLEGYDLDRLKNAIEDGIINWHGLPFTTHTELMDKDLFEFGLSLSQKLDKQFKRKTITGKMTDVPGHTKAIVSSLHKSDIKFLHISVDPALTVPQIPNLFTWVGDDGSEVIVNYSFNDGRDTILPGMTEVLHFAYTNSKGQPFSREMVMEEFKLLKEKYPNAEIVASTLDSYAESLIHYKDSLPRVFEEIGDSWIHGVGSDPSKISKYRELLRLRRKWINSGMFKGLESELEDFSLNLLLIPEHTWGLHINHHLADYINYSKEKFVNARKVDVINDNEKSNLGLAPFNQSYSNVEEAWQEQREYLFNAIASLPEELRKESNENLEKLSPMMMKQTDNSVQLNINQKYEFSNFTVEFDKNGAISFLDHIEYGNIFDSNNRCGLFLYEEIGAESYDFWFNNYLKDFRSENNWAYEYFGKPFMESEGTITSEHKAFFKNGFYYDNGNFITVALNLSGDEYVVKNLGCPRDIQVIYRFFNDTLDIDLIWNNKDALRLPESIWFSINPKVGNENMWYVKKMEELISPLQVVRNGGRNLHAISDSVHYLGAEKKLKIKSQDAPLVAIGERKILKFDNIIVPSQGINFNLYNNIWGTNYRMWYDEDAKFRFTISLAK